MKLRPALPAVALGLTLWTSSSCAPSGFADPTQLASVRVLTTSADKPYAAPGDTVNLQLLAYDGRPSQPEPMTVTWIPLLCENPTDDAYYSCFQQLAGGADGGAPGGPTDGGLNLSGLSLPTGSSFSFTMPADAVTSHPATPGAPTPYGLVIVFNAACAGHLAFTPLDPGNQNPQAVPVGCFDANNQPVGPDGYVFGFTRVYAYDTLTNENPVISGVDVAGKLLSATPTPGIPQAYAAPGLCDAGPGCLTIPHCASGNTSSCQVKMGAVVPSSSWEADPQQTDVHGNPIHEEVWADFYASIGTWSDDARLLYDPIAGSVGAPKDTDSTFQAPSDPGQGTLWIVVHDNRGGASWVTIPVQIQ